MRLRSVQEMSKRELGKLKFRGANPRKALKGREIGWWRDPESNRGHKDFQSSALPTELSRHAIDIVIYAREDGVIVNLKIQKTPR